MMAYVFFKPGVSEADAAEFADRIVEKIQNYDTYFDMQAHYRVAKPKENEPFIAKIELTGIARHPAQLYESISCIILFLFLLWLWNRHKENLVPGKIFGIFLVWLWTMRFLSEFLKENQEDFEATLPINMGQILSIPLIIAGIIILVMVSRKKTSEKSGS
jgi:prolipoprotein diacylglyceryltransferase